MKFVSDLWAWLVNSQFHIVRYVFKFTFKCCRFLAHTNISTMSRVGAFLTLFTPPEELAMALDDEEFKKIISRIRNEWWAAAAAVCDFLTFRPEEN